MRTPEQRRAIWAWGATLACGLTWLAAALLNPAGMQSGLNTSFATLMAYGFVLGMARDAQRDLAELRYNPSGSCACDICETARRSRR